MNYSFTFFCPAYFDEKSIPVVVEKAHNLFSKVAEDYEIIIVHDCSPDNTGAVADSLALKYPKVRVVHHSVNKGYGRVIKTGFQEAGQFDFICFTDGDNQYDVYDFEKMFPLLDQYDAVIGYRVENSNNPARQFISFAYNFILRTFFSIPFKDLSCALRIVKREAAEGIHVESDSSFMPAELILRLHRKGYKVGEVPIRTYPRLHGKSTIMNMHNTLWSIREIIKLRLKLFFEGLNESKPAEKSVTYHKPS